MSRRPNSKALARAVYQGKMDCDVALECHLHDNCRNKLDFQDAHIVLSYAAMGRWDAVFDLAEKKMTVAEMIEEFRLRPFVKLFTGEDQNEINLGELVEAMGQTYRVIGIRQVWPFAAPRFDDWQVMLETLEGKPLHLAGLSEVTKLTERDSTV